MLQFAPSRDMMTLDAHIEAGASMLTQDDLARMERQLIPLLNTVRLMLGKRPVIVPGEKRTSDA